MQLKEISKNQQAVNSKEEMFKEIYATESNDLNDLQESTRLIDFTLMGRFGRLNYFNSFLAILGLSCIGYLLISVMMQLSPVGGLLRIFAGIVMLLAIPFMLSIWFFSVRSMVLRGHDLGISTFPMIAQVVLFPIGIIVTSGFLTGLELGEGITKGLEFFFSAYFLYLLVLNLWLLLGSGKKKVTLGEHLHNVGVTQD